MLTISEIVHPLRCYSKKNVLPKLNATIQKNVVVSLTTTPVRIKKIWPTLNSIMRQSERPEKIYLWLPKQFKRFPHHTIDQLPDFIKNNPLIHVAFIDKDFGPATKLLPCLQFLAGQDKKIIVIDDDRIYSQHLIRDLLRYERIEPSSAIGIAGVVIMGSNRRDYIATKKIALVDVLLGYQGYLVKPQFFSEEIFEYPNDLPEAFFEDDVWISGHMQKRGIRRVLIPSKPSGHSHMLRDKTSFSLCKHENKDKQNFMGVFNYFKP